MNNKIYSEKWAESVWKQFYEKYARAINFTHKTWRFDKKKAIFLLRTNQDRWEKYKKLVKLVDKFIVKPYGPTHIKHVECVERVFFSNCDAQIATFRR